MPLTLEQALRGEQPPMMTKPAWSRMHGRSRELMIEALRKTVEADNMREAMLTATAFVYTKPEASSDR